MASCSQEEVGSLEETSVVSFSAQLPQSVATRGTGDLSVDQVECGVFEDGIEIEALRKTVPITDEGHIEYAPTLIKGRTYQVVFWASKEGQYNADDMYVITRAENPTSKDETEFDAFTAFENFTVENTCAKTITLQRPLAKLNVGVTEADWKAVNDLDLTPMAIKIQATVPTTFNACLGSAMDEQTVEYVIPINENKTLENEGISYHHLAECFIMMSSEEKELSEVSISIYADNECTTPIRENIKIPNLPLQSNYNTNVMGGLMTATVTYSIGIEPDFAEDDKQENIQ